MVLTRRRIAATCAALVLPLGAVTFLAAPAHAAGATRTWVSGVGDDINPCSRTAPCKTFAGAISKTEDGGIINVLDPGGFGAVTTTKSITIDGGGFEASVLASGISGVLVNVTGGGHVVLKNLDVNGSRDPVDDGCQGLNGVSLVGSGSLVLDNVEISGFQNAVATPLNLAADGTRSEVSITNSRIVDNCSAGVSLEPSSAARSARVVISDTDIVRSGAGIRVKAGNEAWVAGTTLAFNDVALVGPGAIHSLCGNALAANTTPSFFTDERCDNQPPPAPLAYCTVPSLRKKSAAAAKEALVVQGCALGKVGKRRAATKLRKKVVAQSIPAGTRVAPGTPVAVVIGR